MNTLWTRIELDVFLFVLFAGYVDQRVREVVSVIFVITIEVFVSVQAADYIMTSVYGL